MTTTCPACAKPASGKFCSHCGASLAKTRDCGKCGNRLPAGGKFCNMCGTAVAPGAVAAAALPASPTRGARSTVWLAAAGGVGVLIVLLVVLLRDSPTPVNTPAAAALAAPGVPLGDPSAIDLSAITPRDAAIRLFDRVMTSVSAGDSVSARSFAPMAIAAYDRVDSLTIDDRYHLAVLHLVNRDATGSRQAAADILGLAPTHLFGLYWAAQAERLLGNSETARALYRQFLDNYDAELTTSRIEYTEHANALQAMKTDAEGILAND